MTRGFWKDSQGYLDTYWSRWKDVWFHGDWAMADKDDYWFLLGRSDDTLKVSGRRVGPAEIESALMSHSAVSEAAAIGVPDDVTGQSVVCFVVCRSGSPPSDSLREALKQHVVRLLGRALSPKEVKFVSELPKTRSAKVVRRVIRAKYLGQELGDLTSIENPGAIEQIAKALQP
jgi:acetyl-CoA synthetase